MDYFNTAYCPNCNAELEPDARFCIMCGAAVPETAPEPVFGSSGTKFCSCGAENDMDSAFCIRCGRMFEEQNDLFYKDDYEEYDQIHDQKICSCGTVNEPDSMFCVGCGQPFENGNISGYESADNKVCSCGMVNEPDSMFCVGCGQPLNNRTEDTGSHSAVCSNCGSVIEPGDRFCTVCAAPVDDSMALSRCPECNGIINPSTGKCGICGFLKKIPASSVVAPPDNSSGKEMGKSGELVINVEHKPEREYTREMEKAKSNFKVSTEFDV